MRWERARVCVMESRPRLRLVFCVWKKTDDNNRRGGAARCICHTKK
jgi:hypothetical protein